MEIRVRRFGRGGKFARRFLRFFADRAGLADLAARRQFVVSVVQRLQTFAVNLFDDGVLRRQVGPSFERRLRERRLNFGAFFQEVGRRRFAGGVFRLRRFQRRVALVDRRQIGVEIFPQVRRRAFEPRLSVRDPSVEPSGPIGVNRFFFEVRVGDGQFERRFRRAAVRRRAVLFALDDRRRFEADLDDDRFDGGVRDVIFRNRPADFAGRRVDRQTVRNLADKLVANAVGVFRRGRFDGRFKRLTGGRFLRFRALPFGRSGFFRVEFGVGDQNFERFFARQAVFEGFAVFAEDPFGRFDDEAERLRAERRVEIIGGNRPAYFAGFRVELEIFRVIVADEFVNDVVFRRVRVFRDDGRFERLPGFGGRVFQLVEDRRAVNFGDFKRQFQRLARQVAVRNDDFERVFARNRRVRRQLAGFRVEFQPGRRVFGDRPGQLLRRKVGVDGFQLEFELRFVVRFERRFAVVLDFRRFVDFRNGQFQRDVRRRAVRSDEFDRKFVNAGPEPFARRPGEDGARSFVVRRQRKVGVVGVFKLRFFDDFELVRGGRIVFKLRFGDGNRNFERVAFVDFRRAGNLVKRALDDGKRQRFPDFVPEPVFGVKLDLIRADAFFRAAPLENAVRRDRKAFRNRVAEKDLNVGARFAVRVDFIRQNLELARFAGEDDERLVFDDVFKFQRLRVDEERRFGRFAPKRFVFGDVVDREVLRNGDRMFAVRKFFGVGSAQFQNGRRLAGFRVDRFRRDRKGALNAVDLDERRRFVRVRNDRDRQERIDRIRRNDRRAVFEFNDGDAARLVGDERKFRRGRRDVKLLIVSFRDRAVVALDDDRQFRRLRAGQVGFHFVNVRRIAVARQFDRNAFESGFGVNLIRQLRTGVFGGKFERFRRSGDRFDFGRDQRVELLFVDDADDDFLELRRAVRGGSGDRDRRFARNAFRRDETQRAVGDFLRFENANVFKLIRVDRFRLFARRVGDDRRFFDLLDNVVTVDDVTEYVVAAVEPGRLVERNVNLRVARVRAFVCERDDPGAAVRQEARMFVVDRLTGAFVTLAVRRAALEHKSGVNTVERFSFVIAVVDQFKEVRGRIRRFAFRFEELQNDLPERRNGPVGRRFRNGERDLRAGRKRNGQTVERSGIDDLRVRPFERVMVGIAGRYRDRIRQRLERSGAVQQLARLQNFK